MEEATCERIIMSIDAIMKKDPLLDEFDVIYSSGEVNKTPVIHIDHKLALESWCVKYVYKHAYASTLHLKSTGGFENICSLLRWTQICLLLMPEVSTFWNLRKKMLRKKQVDLDRDLLLSNLVLTRKPKCIEAFQHRKWLFDNIITRTNSMEVQEVANNNNERNNEQSLQQHLIAELHLCTWTANRKQNNYHAWNHRLWVMDKLCQIGDIEEFLSAEYSSSHEWISYHVSEHSGMHYHTKLVDKILQYSERGVLCLKHLSGVENSEFLYKKELNTNKELMLLYPGHESLFYLRRVMLMKLHSVVGNHGQKPSSPPPALKRSCIETLSSDWNQILQGELDLAKNVESHPLIFEQHINWVKNVMAL